MTWLPFILIIAAIALMRAYHIAYQVEIRIARQH